jgi:hypothetical protein
VSLQMKIYPQFTDLLVVFPADTGELSSGQKGVANLIMAISDDSQNTFPKDNEYYIILAY